MRRSAGIDKYRNNSPGSRRLNTASVTTADRDGNGATSQCVIWLGAVAAFLALAIAGLTSQDAQLVRAVYLAMAVIARFVIVPLSFAPLLTGPVLSLGTPWGLFRHYWILVKLLITILSTIILQIHMQPINLLANTTTAVSAS